jgi:hypothetical protein
MLKTVLATLVVSSVMLGGVAYAADTTSTPAGQTATQSTDSTTSPAKASPMKKHAKVAMKHHKQMHAVKAEKKTDTTTPTKSN